MHCIVLRPHYTSYHFTGSVQSRSTDDLGDEIVTQSGCEGQNASVPFARGQEGEEVV